MRAVLFVAAFAACSSHGPSSVHPERGATGPEPKETEIGLPPPAPKEAPPPTLRLPTSFAPTGYHARLRIDPAKPRFDGEITIDATLAAATPVVWLHAETLVIDRADADGVVLTATPRGDHFLELRADKPLPAGAVHVHVVYHGAITDSEYRGAWRRQWGGDWYVFTQFEALSARRVFPCVDEPSVKVPWQLTLEVPAGDVAVGNAPATITPIDGGWQRYELAPTRPLPSYLIAFAVGPFESVDGGTTPGGAPIHVFAPKGRAGEAAFAAKVTREIVADLEAYFGSPYAYPKLDEIATAGAGGAMENAGAITYAERIILIDPADPSLTPRRRFLSVGSHEVAHHWVGDLVTTAWWDDIWLNEAFAEWMQDKIVAQIDPAARADLSDVAMLGDALDADDLSSARMIRQPIASEDDVLGAFDGITYAKGASVLRMFERWVGPDTFRTGVRAYLAAHADRNATADDFLAAISAAAGKDVKTPFATFLDQAGAPRVTATVTCKPGASPTVALHQERYLPRGAAAPSGAPRWQIPVCVVYGDDRGGRPSRECTMLAATDDTMTLANACPTWLYANASAAGYYRVGMTAAELTAVTKHWRALGDGERLELTADAGAMIAHGDVDPGVALALVPELLRDPPAAEVEAAAKLAARVEPFVPVAQRFAYQAWIRKTFGARAAKLGWTAHKGESEDAERERLAIVPLVANTGADAALRRAAVGLAAKWQSLPISIRRSVLEAASSDGKTFDALLAQVHAITEPRALRDLIGALSAVRDPARLARVLPLSLDAALDWTVSTPIAFGAAPDPALRSAAAAWARAHIDEILARVPAISRGSFAWMVVFDCDPATRDDAVKLAARFRAYPGGPRIVDQAVERLDECIAQKALQSPALAKSFGAK